VQFVAFLLLFCRIGSSFHASLSFVFNIKNFVSDGLLVPGSIVFVLLLVGCRGLDNNRFCFRLLYLFSLLAVLLDFSF